MRPVLYSVAVTLGSSDQAVLLQSPCIVYADQVPVRSWFMLDPEVLSVPVDENFSQKTLSVAPSSTSYLEGGKTLRKKCELGIIYRVKRMGLLRIMGDKLTLTSHYPVFRHLKVDTT